MTARYSGKNESFAYAFDEQGALLITTETYGGITIFSRSAESEAKYLAKALKSALSRTNPTLVYSER